MANTITTPNRSFSRTKKPLSFTAADSSFEVEENDNNESDDDFEAGNNTEGEDDGEAKEDEEDAAYAPKSIPSKRKAVSTNTTPVKKAKTSDKAKAAPKPRTPKKPKQVHKAEPILSKLDKAVQKGLKKGETTLDQKTVVAILDYVSVLLKGCDEAGTTEELFEKHYAENGGSAKEEPKKKVPLSEKQIKLYAELLADDIISGMSKKMKWVSACKYAAAPVSVAGNCDDNDPAIYVKLLKLDESHLNSKAPVSFEYTISEFEDRFGDTPTGSARYDTLYLQGKVTVQWWPRTGRYKVSGYYGKWLEK